MSEVVAAFRTRKFLYESTARRHRAGLVRPENFRRKALNALKDNSIGLRSGEYAGKYATVAPRRSIASFTPACENTALAIRSPSQMTAHADERRNTRRHP